MINILFISWDGPQTNYMEGLFMPIFSRIQKQSNYVFHIIQFTWGTSERIATTQKAAQDFQLIYTPKTIYRKPNSTIGSFISVHNGIRFLKKYMLQNKIEILMPRSTMPALMVNRITENSFKILFDADGLPLEERIDFSNLKKTSYQYRYLKNEENKIILNANGIITRSFEAIRIHNQNLSTANKNKFNVVVNGRDTEFFKPNPNERIKKRQELNLSNDAKIFVYCGSLGPQYCLEEMLQIFENYHNTHLNSYFLILTGNIEFARERIPKDLIEFVILKSVIFEQIPEYLSIADLAFAIREPKPSMKGIAPIKLGEYLLMGIPTIASAGIGDTEQILKEIPNCFIYDHHNLNRVSNAVNFVQSQKEFNHEKIRKKAISFFSLEKSVESYLIALDNLI